MNDRNLNCFSSSRCGKMWGEGGREGGKGRGEGEVFVPPYKSQYPLVSAVVRERRRQCGGKGRIKVREREGGGRRRTGRQLVANGIWKYLVYGRNSRRFLSHVGFVARTNRKRRRNCVRRDNSSLCTLRTYLLFIVRYMCVYIHAAYVHLRLCMCVPNWEVVGFLCRGSLSLSLSLDVVQNKTAIPRTAIYCFHSTTLPSTNAERVLSD